MHIENINEKNTNQNDDKQSNRKKSNKNRTKIGKQNLPEKPQKNGEFNNYLKILILVNYHTWYTGKYLHPHENF